MHGFYSGQVYDLFLFVYVLDYLGFDRFPQKATATIAMQLQQAMRANSSVLIINPVYKQEDMLRMLRFENIFSYFGYSSHYREEPENALGIFISLMEKQGV